MFVTDLLVTSVLWGLIQHVLKNWTTNVVIGRLKIQNNRRTEWLRNSDVWTLSIAMESNLFNTTALPLRLHVKDLRGTIAHMTPTVNNLLTCNVLLGPKMIMMISILILNVLQKVNAMKILHEIA